MNATATTDRTFSAEARLLTVQSWMVDGMWPLVAPFVERWLEHDGIWTADEIKDELKAARAQLWCLYCGEIKGIWVTRIECGGRLAVVWGCAGDFQSLKEEAIAMYGQIEDWFRSMGCKYAEWCGREGWARLFPDYERHAVVMRKRL